MGNQPSRRTTKRKGSTVKFPRKLVNDAKSSIKKKKYKDAANYAIKAGLKNSGKNILAASILAGAIAYSKSQKLTKPKIQKITSQSLNQIIRKNNFEVSQVGRNVIKFSIDTILASRKK